MSNWNSWLMGHAVVVVPVLVLMPLAAPGAEAGTRDAELLRAAKGNVDSAIVRTLVKQGADVNAQQPDGTSALLWAAQWDNLASAQALLSASAKVDAANDYGVTALAIACRNGSAPMVELLLNAGADPNQKNPSDVTPLMTAARAGFAPVIKTLLARKADVHAKEKLLGQTALMWATAERHVDVVMTLLEAGADMRGGSNDGFTPLHFAAREGDSALVQLALDHGADINTASKAGATALHVAAVRGHVDLALLLLDRGANPNADGVGYTVLHWAVWSPESALIKDYVSNIEQGEWSALGGIRNRAQKIGLIRALIRKGADVNARVKKQGNPPAFGGGSIQFYGGGSTVGATPFLMATQSADAEIMRLLLANGADPSIGTDDGSTTLMLAAGLGNYEENTLVTEAAAFEAVKICLALGDEVNAANQKGNTALHASAYPGRTVITRYLAEHGANLEPQNKKGLTPMKVAEFSNESGMLPFYHPQTAALLKELGATK